MSLSKPLKILLRQRPSRRVPYLRVANVKDGWLDLSHEKEVEATEADAALARLRGLISG